MSTAGSIRPPMSKVSATPDPAFGMTANVSGDPAGTRFPAVHPLPLGGAGVDVGAAVGPAGDGVTGAAVGAADGVASGEAVCGPVGVALAMPVGEGDAVPLVQEASTTMAASPRQARRGRADGIGLVGVVAQVAGRDRRQCAICQEA